MRWGNVGHAESPEPHLLQNIEYVSPKKAVAAGRKQPQAKGDTTLSSGMSILQGLVHPNPTKHRLPFH